MEMGDPPAIVDAWLEAVNSQDINRLVALSDPNTEIVGPRGSGYGHQVLRDWLSRAGLTLRTTRVFARGHTVVVAQHAVWRSVETGEMQGEADIASRFVVDSQRVAQFARYDSLDSALAETGLDQRDEIVQH
ncbi:MAG: nuclear transport factor 2 family protein [Anaerolineae bacterium]